MSIQIPPKDDTADHDMGEGIFFQWLENGTVALIEARNGNHRPVVDLWAEVYKSLVDLHADNYPDDHLYVIYDIYSYDIYSGGSMTSYKQKLADEAAFYYDEKVKAYVCVVLPKGILSHLLRWIANIAYSQKFRHNKREAFITREDALRAIRAHQAQEQNQPIPSA